MDCNRLNININQQQYHSIMSVVNYYNELFSSPSKILKWKEIVSRRINERKYQLSLNRKRQFKKYVQIYRQLLVLHLAFHVYLYID